MTAVKGELLWGTGCSGSCETAKHTNIARLCEKPPESLWAESHLRPGYVLQPRNW